MKKLGKLFILFFISAILVFTGCSQANPSTTTSTSQTTTIPISSTITNFAFHDYNGNGTQDIGEPPIEGITLTYQPGNFSCITDNDGKGTVNIAAGSYKIYVSDDTSKKFRYFLPSVSEVIKVEDGLSVSITGNTTVAVPLAEGFLTLPYNIDTPFEVGKYFDYDPRPNYFLYWNDHAGYGQYERNHVGTDFIVSDNGIKVVAPAPGQVVQVNTDPNGGYSIEVQTSVGDFYQVAHVNPDSSVQVGISISRGQYIGTVDYPPGPPHTHIGIYQRRSDGLFMIDSFSPSISNPIEYRLESSGDITPVDSQPSLGYWTKENDPQYP